MTKFLKIGLRVDSTILNVLVKHMELVLFVKKRLDGMNLQVNTIDSVRINVVKKFTPKNSENV